MEKPQPRHFELEKMLVLRQEEWALSLLLFLSITAICIVPVKFYPATFALSEVLAAFALLFHRNVSWRTPLQRNAWWGGVAYLLFVSGSYVVIGGDTITAVKITVNVLFFLALARLSVAMMESGRGDALRTVIRAALLVSIIANCFQAFVSVAHGGLWTLPLRISNSMDAYAIQSAAPMIIGDENKNIWATKVMFEYLIYITLRRGRWRIRESILMFCFVFVLVYTSSRTAQLSCVAGVTGLVLQKWWPHRGKRILVISAMVPVFFGLIHYLRISSLDFDLAEGTSGDGLLARLFLWNYFGASLRTFSVGQIVFGHGVFAVSDFVHSRFSENNLHDVFLNEFYDFGLIGLLSYCSMIVFFISSLARDLRWVFVPVLIIVLNSQYFGYDAELVMLFAVGPLLLGSQPTGEGR